MNKSQEIQDALKALSDLIDSLLAPNGCAWDKEQTPASLTEYLMEETCELVDAIRFGSKNDFREELGDVLFLLVFIARLSTDAGGPNLAEALSAASEKMIRRHPHVFAGTKFDSLAEQFRAWDAIKREEKIEQLGDAAPKGLFASLPTNMPPLTKAYRLHSKAARIGFTWPEDQEVEQQVEAEWLEVLDTFTLSGDDAKARMAHELGDHMFTLVELARRKGIKAAEALDGANHRFLTRFEEMETLASARGLVFADLTLDEQDTLWNEVKAAEKPRLPF